MLLDGDFNDVDIMLGSTTNECNQFLLGGNIKIYMIYNYQMTFFRVIL